MSSHDYVLIVNEERVNELLELSTREPLEVVLKLLLAEEQLRRPIRAFSSRIISSLRPQSQEELSSQSSNMLEFLQSAQKLLVEREHPSSTSRAKRNGECTQRSHDTSRLVHASLYMSTDAACPNCTSSEVG